MSDGLLAQDQSGVEPGYFRLKCGSVVSSSTLLGLKHLSAQVPATQDQSSPLVQDTKTTVSSCNDSFMKE